MDSRKLKHSALASSFGQGLGWCKTVEMEHRFENYLIRGVRQSRPLKALRDLPPQLVGISNGLEEEGVLLHSLDAKGVVDAAHSKNQNVVLHFKAALIHASIGREAGHYGLLLWVNLAGHCLKIFALQQQSTNNVNKQAIMLCCPAAPYFAS